MSFANTTAHSEWSVNAGKSYVTTGAFNNAFYTYTVTQNSNFQTIGTLTLAASTTTACPGGRHLVLNGRKLTPGANPMNFITGAASIGNNPYVYGSSYGAALVALSATGSIATTGGAPFVPKFMVGVADVVSGLSGFIDPTNVLFAQYDKNRPTTDYIVDMNTGMSLAAAITLAGSGQSDRINTKSTFLTTGGTYSAGGASTGTVVLTAATSGAVSQAVTSSIVTPNSIIILTPVSGVTGSTATNGVASVSAIGVGTFTISFTGISAPAATSIPATNFLIIN